MTILRRLFGKSDELPGGLNASNVRFDDSGWNVQKREAREVVWLDELGNALSLTLNRASGFVIAQEVDKARSMARGIASEAGASLVVGEPLTVGDDYQALKLIYKREDGSGYAYTGMLIVRRPDVMITICIAARERGLTGVREAVVTSNLIEQGELTVETYPKRWFSDPYDDTYSGTILRSISDDEKYDHMFPEHPLTVVREMLARVCATFAISRAPES